MASYIVRRLEPEFWQRVKAKALAEQVTIQDLIVRLLNDWLTR